MLIQRKFLTVRIAFSVMVELNGRVGNVVVAVAW
jgi:hypothetical protein